MNRIKEVREQKGLSQATVAKDLKVNLRSFQRWESGETNMRQKNAQALADYFGVSVGYLLGYEERKTQGMVYELLVEKIKHWAVEKGIGKADPNIQWMRVTEEVGEIRDVLLKPSKFENPEQAMKDAIGDSLVTLIVLAYQLGLDTVECLDIAYNEIKDRNGKMINGTFVKQEDLK